MSRTMDDYDDYNECDECGADIELDATLDALYETLYEDGRELNLCSSCRIEWLARFNGTDHAA